MRRYLLMMEQQKNPNLMCLFQGTATVEWPSGKIWEAIKILNDAFRLANEDKGKDRQRQKDEQTDRQTHKLTRETKQSKEKFEKL